MSAGVSRPSQDPSGEKFGPWRALGELGHGGMGRVLLVERTSPQQRAALKILPAGSQSAKDRSRFRREQEILARLEHPNIARFLDAGETPQGQLYLVAEMVEGVPIDVYCAGLDAGLEKAGLDGLHRRIEVFLALCRAVAAAHRQLILHCDLKPSNVLVRQDGTVKLLDFGAARLAGEGGPATAASQFSTWAYASPEQLAGKPLSAGADVYSLGVMLFEILTGKQPFLGAGSGFLDQLAGRDDPPLPSSRLPAGSARSLRRAVRQDLDFVVAKALRARSAERYLSVDEMIADLEAFLGGSPVAARRGGRLYVASRFLRRHALAATIGGLLLLLAAGAVVALGLQTRRLEAERDAAREQERIASRTALYFLDLVGRRPGARTIESLADRAALELDTSLQDSPAVRAQVLFLLADHYRLRGYVGRGERLAGEVLSLVRGSPRISHPSLVTLLETLAVIRFQLSDVEGGCRLAAETMQLTSAADRDSRRISALNALGLCEFNRGRAAEADRLLTEAAEMSAAAEGWGSRRYEASLFNLILVKEQLQRSAELEELYRRLLDVRRFRRPFLNDSHTIRWTLKLAALLVARGALEEAEDLLQRTLLAFAGDRQPGAMRVLSAPHPAEAQLQLADILRQSGRAAEALKLAERAAEALRFDLPPDNRRHRNARLVQALALRDAGDPAAALARLERLQRELEAVEGPAAAAAIEEEVARTRTAARGGKHG